MENEVADIWEKRVSEMIVDDDTSADGYEIVDKEATATKELYNIYRAR